MYQSRRCGYDADYNSDNRDEDWHDVRKRRYPFDEDLRYDFTQSLFEDNYGKRRLSWYDSNGAPSTQTSIDYHHGLAVDEPLQEQDLPGITHERTREKWRRDRPTQTLFVGGVPRYVEEDDIRRELEDRGFSYRDVRMARHRFTGANRGFAFVEFHSVDDARRFMEHNQGCLVLHAGSHGSRTVTLDYSHPGHSQPTVELAPPPSRQSQRAVPPTTDVDRPGDWRCAKCRYNNFKRRERCFKCNIHHDESERLEAEDGFDQVGCNPCNTLLLRGLDAMTVESSILQALSQVSSIPLKSVCVMRSPVTGLSLGYAFVELHSLRDSSALLDIVSQLRYPVDVDGKAVMMSYSCNTFSTVMSYLADQHHSLRSEQTSDSTWLPPGDVVTMVTDSAADPTASVSDIASTSTTTTATVEPLASAAAGPDVTTFSYDESSGYYYDAVTGYYYDAGTQYFYNPETCQFIYWNYETQSYHPVPTDTQTVNTSEEQTNDADDKSSSEPATAVDNKAKKEKALHAKKIVKDMERWAKVQNAQKDSSSASGFKKPLAPISAAMKSRESATADAGFTVLSKAKMQAKSDKFTMEIMKGRDDKRPSSKAVEEKAKPVGLVASYGESDSESEEEPDTPSPAEWDAAAVEEKMTDWPKLTCLLCKRLFNSREILVKHQQMSDLHKSNLEDLRLQSSSKRR